MLLIVLNISNGAKQPSCTKRGLLLLILNLQSNIWIFPLKISFKYAWLSFGSTCCSIFDSVQKFFHWSLLTWRHYELFWRNIDHHLKSRNHRSLGNSDKKSKRGIEQTSNEWMKPKLKKHWISINLNIHIFYRPWLLSFEPCTESAFPDHTWPIITI